ncbi:MAG: nuclear transport factor 2 family protein [Acidimicrobiia bacterium]
MPNWPAPTEPSATPATLARTVLTRYAFAVDDSDLETLAGLVDPDVALELTAGTLSGREAVREFYGGTFASRRFSRHLITDVDVTSVEGTGADERVGFRARFLFASVGDAVRSGIGTYRGTLRREGGEPVLTALEVQLDIVADGLEAVVQLPGAEVPR